MNKVLWFGDCFFLILFPPYATLYSGKVYCNISVIHFSKCTSGQLFVFIGMYQTEEPQI